jgi:hypothetical protein
MQIDEAELANEEALATYQWLRVAHAAQLRSDSEFEAGLRALKEEDEAAYTRLLEGLVDIDETLQRFAAMTSRVAGRVAAATMRIEGPS